MKLLGIQSKMDFAKYYQFNKEEVDKKIGILKFVDRKLVNQSLGLNYKDTDALSLLCEYHQHLQEATTRYPTRFINLEFLKYLCSRNHQKVKNPFSLMPAQHQAIIKQVIQQIIEQKILDQKFLYQEKMEREKNLRRFEMQLERLNFKNHNLMK